MLIQCRMYITDEHVHIQHSVVFVCEHLVTHVGLGTTQYELLWCLG